MQRYKIQDITNDGAFCSVVVTNAKNAFKTIDLPAKVGEKAKVGGKVTVLQDKDLGVEDYVYLYRGDMCFHTKPASFDIYSCKCYLGNLPGVFDSFKLDRAIFKFAIARECWHRRIRPSMAAWRNLQNVFLWDAYSPLVR